MPIPWTTMSTLCCPILDMDDQADRENQNSLYKNYKDVASNVTGAGARDHQ